jgi:hypothetical protein
MSCLFPFFRSKHRYVPKASQESMDIESATLADNKMVGRGLGINGIEPLKIRFRKFKESEYL